MHKHYTASWRRCRECDRPADGMSEYCEDHDTDENQISFEIMKECDCCGKRKPGVELIWCDSVGDTYACPKCRGWDEADEQSVNRIYDREDQ